MTYSSLRSIGAYIPKQIRNNSWFESRMDTTDEWITQRTGIKERRVADNNMKTSDLGVEAAKIAIKRSDINLDDIDLVLCATLSPDYLAMPSTACMIAKKLGIKDVMAFDISAACTGFIYALNIANSFIKSGAKKNILIVAAEKITPLLNYEDRSTCFIFGDGAGACILSSTTNKNESLIDIHCSSDGNYHDYLYTPLTKDKQYINMEGNKTFKVAVKKLSEDVKNILENNKLTYKDIDFFVPHQANKRILNVVADNLGFEAKQVVVTVDKYANTSAASIPMAINHIYENGDLKYGQTLLLDAFGGGFTWGSAILKFCCK